MAKHVLVAVFVQTPIYEKINTRSALEAMIRGAREMDYQCRAIATNGLFIDTDEWLKLPADEQINLMFPLDASGSPR